MKNNPLAKSFTFASVIKFTLPTIVMMVFMSMYTMVDGIFVSNLVGSEALSAINIVYPYVSIVVAVAIMLVTGGSAVIARKMGEGNNREAKENFTLIVITGLVVGVVIGAIGVIFNEPILKLLGSTESLDKYCKDYLTILAFGAPLSVLQMLFQFLFVAAGKPKLGLISTVLGGIANILLDYIFIGPMNLGINGAGYGTVIGYAIPALWGIIYFTFCRKGTLYFVRPKFDYKALINSCLNGSSEMVTNLATAVTTLLFNIITLKYLGESGVAAITIVLYAQFLLTSIFLGFSSGIAPVFSYNYGTQNRKELHKIFKISMIFVSVVSILTFAAALLLSGSIVSVFVRPGDVVYDIAKNGFLLFSISFIFTGMNIFASSLFTSLSNGVISALISFLRTFLLLTSSIVVLPMLIGEPGIWLAVPIAEVLTIVVSIIMIVKYKKKYQY